MLSGDSSIMNEDTSNSTIVSLSSINHDTFKTVCQSSSIGLQPTETLYTYIRQLAQLMQVYTYRQRLYREWKYNMYKDTCTFCSLIALIVCAQAQSVSCVFGQLNRNPN
jgi:hypothetical protein